MHSMPPGGELLAQPLLAEARNADDALAGRRPLGEPRQGRSDLAADAENDEVAGNASRSAIRAGAGAVITSSRCSTSRKRSGSAALESGIGVLSLEWLPLAT